MAALAAGSTIKSTLQLAGLTHLAGTLLEMGCAEVDDLTSIEKEDALAAGISLHEFEQLLTAMKGQSAAPRGSKVDGASSARLRGILAEARIEQYAEALRNDLGCVEVEDLGELQICEAMQIGMSKVEFKRMLRIAGVSETQIKERVAVLDPTTSTSQPNVAVECEPEPQSTRGSNQVTTKGESEQLLQILAKLPSMSVKDLKRQARSLGVDEERIESLDDLEDVKVGSIALVEEAIRAQLEAGAAAWALEQAKADAALRAQLADVSVKLLKRQARGLGVSAQAIEDLDDADDVKQAAIEMVVQASRAL
jgi:hypothetical protein